MKPRAHRFAAVFIFLMVFLPLAGLGAATVPSAAASGPSGVPHATAALTPAVTGIPVQEGGFLTNDRHFLVFNGILTWGGSYQVVTNNTQVYAASFILVIYSLVTVPTTIPLSLTEFGNTYNQTTTVSPGVADVVTINLVQSNSWTWATLKVDSTPQVYQVAVPISFLPNNIANVGGLDLIALAIISECLISLALAVSLAYGIMRRALWAPKFSLLVWGHVILIGIATAVILDFQTVDQVFAGWSPLVYAFFLFPIFFLFSLSYFNQAPTAELLQANAPLSGRLSFNRWEIRVAREPKQGRWVLIGERRRDMVARFLQHHVPLTAVESVITQPEPFMADITNRRIVSKEMVMRRVRRPTPEKSNPLDDFEVIPVSINGRPQKGKYEPPYKLLFTPVGRPVEVVFPRLSMHKEVLVPADVSPEGQVIVPEHYERKLCRPYYTPGHANITLHTIHFRSAMSVVAGWRTADDLADVLNNVVLDLEAVKANYHTAVNKKTREKLLARELLEAREEDDLSEEEATLESVREKREYLPSLDALFGRGLIPHNLSPQQTKKPEKK